MAIRYFKCHSLPYPSFSLGGASSGAGVVDLAWSNGPPGGYSAITSHIEYATLAATATTTVTTVAGTAITARITGIATIGPTDHRFRIRRQNAEGYGDWSSYVTIQIQ